MHIRLILSSAAIVATSSCYSQDIITMKNGDEIKAKVLKVNIDDISYKRHDNIDGPTYSLPKSQLILIRYENGVKDIFTGEADAVYDETGLSMQEKGDMDARKYYTRYTGAMVGTGLSTAFMGYGLIPAIVCSSTPPRYENLGFPDPELMKNQNYKNGYTSRAFHIKKSKTWQGFGIGFGVFLGAVVAVAAFNN